MPQAMLPTPPRSRRAAPSISFRTMRTLAAEIERVRARHGYAILLDGHSIRSEVPRFFAGRLPDLNLGTADGASCAPAFQHAAGAGARRRRGIHHASSTAASREATSRATTAIPARGVHALQLETAQACYMDESPPYPWDAKRAAPLATLLERLVAALLRTRPGH